MLKRKAGAVESRLAFVTIRATKKHEFPDDRIEQAGKHLLRAGFKPDDTCETKLSHDGDECDVTAYFVAAPKLLKGDDWQLRARRTAYGVFEASHELLTELALVTRRVHDAAGACRGGLTSMSAPKGRRRRVGRQLELPASPQPVSVQGAQFR